MKYGTGIALIAVGAILAFAVTANTSFFNLHTAGWVLMIIGVIGILLPGRSYGWLGQRVVRRSYPAGRVEQTTYPARYPSTQALQAGAPTRPTLLDQDLIEDPADPDVPRTVAGRPVVEDVYEP